MEQDEGGKFSLFRCPPSGTRIPRDVKDVGDVRDMEDVYAGCRT